MIKEQDLRNLIQEVLNGLKEEGVNTTSELTPIKAEPKPVDNDNLYDITEVKMKDQLLVKNPVNRDGYMHLKSNTAARIGVGRTGNRPKTQPYLRFRADHATAMDAVFTYVSDEFLSNWGLKSISTLCHDKDEFITRPDLGRRFSEEAVAEIKAICPNKPKVEIYISDGLSSTAIETNGRDTYDAILQGLKASNIEVGSPFFVKHGRVPAMDAVGEITDADVVVVLIGERPGLATGESMSCYMAYRPTVGMPESRRTVVSNIHQGGTPAVEAGAHIADVIKKILDQKASGLDLKL